MSTFFDQFKNNSEFIEIAIEKEEKNQDPSQKQKDSEEKNQEEKQYKEEQEEKQYKEEQEEDEENQQKKNNSKLTVFDSFYQNVGPWLLITLCVTLLSRNIWGIVYFIVIFFAAYVAHVLSHQYNTICTIVHHYHHSHNNFLSHFTQVLVEFSSGFVFFPITYYYPSNPYCSIWVLFFSIILYSTIHNINYGMYHVNKTHALHHREIHTNYGPDILDIMFGTKNKKETKPENINHYYPNILGSFLFIIGLRTLWEWNGGMECIQQWMLFFFHFLATFTLGTLSVFSLYLWFSYDIGPNASYVLFSKQK